MMVRTVRERKILSCLEVKPVRGPSSPGALLFVRWMAERTAAAGRRHSSKQLNPTGQVPMQSALEQQTLTAVPAYLNTPPLTVVNPPVVTRAQALPFGELAWEDFERLCLRLARRNRPLREARSGQRIPRLPVQARERLRRSQDQKGRRQVPRRRLGKKARTLVLCTKESLIATERANEVEAQRERLTKEEVALLTWDSQQLALLLKGHPELVDDFFGRPWATRRGRVVVVEQATHQGTHGFTILASKGRVSVITDPLCPW
jgi:hypothetical protein